MKNRDNIILQKIIDYCEQIDGTLNRFNRNKESFCSDYVYFNACNMCVIQIGELAGNISESFREEHTEIPWRQLRGLRNIYAHNYQGVDYDLAWNALIYDIPQIKKKCEKIITESFEEK